MPIHSSHPNAALARHQQPGLFRLNLNHARITVEGHSPDAEWGASFQSPPTRSGPVSGSVLTEAMGLFGLTPDDLDGRIPPAVAHGGADHLVLGSKNRETLKAVNYDPEKGQALAEREGFVTLNLVYAETDTLFHSLNPFPFRGVYEDPATGAAAAALAGYLRDIGWPHQGTVDEDGQILLKFDLTLIERAKALELYVLEIDCPLRLTNTGYVRSSR